MFSTRIITKYAPGLKIHLQKVHFSEKKRVFHEGIEISKHAAKPKMENAETTKIKSTVIYGDKNEQIMQTIASEKSSDASATSRLAKECNKLSAQKILFSERRLHLNEEKIQASWENYDFNKNKQPKKEVIDPFLSTILGGAGQGPVATSNRPVRGEPGKVIWGFIPHEWFLFFIPKTGVTGFYTFLFTFGTFLVSKEYFVMEHNYYIGLSTALLWWGCIKYFGPDVTRYLDKEIDKYETGWNESRINEKKSLEEQIEYEKNLQWKFEGQLVVIEAKRENIALQLQDEFQKRQIEVYKTVKSKLDYQVEVAYIFSRIKQKNIVDYVIKEVLKSITPEMEVQLYNIALVDIAKEFQKDLNKDPPKK